MNATSKMHQAALAAVALKPFIGRHQMSAINTGLRGEEKEFFQDKLIEYAGRVKAMPVTYEQDGKGTDAVAHLHYFTGGCDWYITEKDVDRDGGGQLQAFGVANIGFDPELGYISIRRIIDTGGELDLYWAPKPLKDIERAGYWL